MLLKPLNSDDIEVDQSNEWGFFVPFYQDFRKRFARLLDKSFRSMDYKLAMSVLDPKISFADTDYSDGFLKSIDGIFSPHDMKRLEAYTNNLVDFPWIMDCVSILAHLYFSEKLPVSLSYVQASVLLCFGLQDKDISQIEAEMQQDRRQILPLFMKTMKKFYKYLYDLASKEIDSTVSRLKEITMEPHAISLDEDLNNAAKQVQEEMNGQQDGLLDPELLQGYAIMDREADFENALQNGGKVLPGGVISVKSDRKKADKVHKGGEKKRHKNGSSSKSSKKRKA